MSISRRLSVTLLIAGVAAFTVSACGGDDDDCCAIEPSAQVRAPKPKEGIGGAADGLSAAISASSCKPLRRYRHSDDPPISDVDCQKVRDSLQGFKARRVDDFRTGGLVNFTTAAGDTGALILVLDSDGRFKIAAGGIFRNTSGLVPRDSDEPKESDAVAAETVEALRDGDCEDLSRLVPPEVVRGRGTEAGCYVGGDRTLQAALRQDTTVKPVRLGIDGLAAVYGLRSGKTFSTFVVVRRIGRPTPLGIWAVER